MVPTHHAGKFLPQTKCFLPHDFTLMCVYLFSGFRGQCFNYVLPIAKIYPPMTSLPYLGLVVLPLRTPGGVW